MSIMMLTTLTLCALLTIDMRFSGRGIDREIARMNARAAAHLALAELQIRVGADKVATAPALSEDGEAAAGWVFAVKKLHGTSTPETQRTPLISGNFFLNNEKQPPFGTTQIVPATRTSFGEFPAVNVPWLGDDTSIFPARFAFWVQDESQKADAGTLETRASLARETDLQRRRQLVSQRHAVDTVWKARRNDIQTWRQGINLSPDWAYLETAWRDDAPEDEPFPLDSHEHAFASRGVLADARNGGLRINWDQTAPLPDEKLPCPRPVWEDFFLRSTASAAKFALTPSAGLPVTGPATDPALRRFPILSALRLRIGVFHSHHDAYNRIRYHAEAQLWNPWAYPLTCVEKDFIGLLDFEKLPILSVRNMNTGAQIQTDMSAFPQGKFGVEQTPSDGTVNANLVFIDPEHPGMDTQGLLAGEVFHFFMPDPDKQPEGLARTLSGVKWYIQSDPKKPNTPPSSTKDNNWLHATHQIEIKGVMPPNGITLHIRQAKGKFSTTTASCDYSPPVLTLKNIPFVNFSIFLSGAEYDRPDSTGYRVSEARFAFSLRLRGGKDDQKKLLDVLEKIDPRNPELDFGDPAVAALYIIEPDVLSTQTLPPATTHTESFWWDARLNKHGGATAPEEMPYSEVRSFDRPSFCAPISAATLRHLPRKDKNAGSLNPKYPQGREEDTDWFDRIFFAAPPIPPKNTTTTATTTTPTAPTTAAPWSLNPWLEPLPSAVANTPAAEDAAAHCLIRGAFNVNCPREESWRIILARTLPEWQRRPREATTIPIVGLTAAADPKITPLENTLFRLPHGADEPRHYGTPADRIDAELKKDADNLQRQSQGAQGFRALESPMRDTLAREIAAAIQRRQNTPRADGAFLSLRDFVQSGIFAEALEKTQLNEAVALGKPPAAFSPLRLNGGDILESILPTLSVRGDTFRVRVRGAVFTALGAEHTRADAEVVVQRFPELFDPTQSPMTPPADMTPINRYFGRRLRIVSFRWLDPGE
jgi:hypothetical protein